MGIVWNKEISSFVFWPPSGLARIWTRNHGFVLQDFVDDISEIVNRWWHHFNTGCFIGDLFVKQSLFRFKSVSQLFYYSNMDFQLWLCSKRCRMYLTGIFATIEMFEMNHSGCNITGNRKSWFNPVKNFITNHFNQWNFCCGRWRILI